jgi:hypothetical protein
MRSIPLAACLIFLNMSVLSQSGKKEKATLPVDESVRQAKLLLVDAKKKLAEAGKYNCCTKDACDRCALDHQSCDCATDVKSGKAVCSDCYAGWKRGEGTVPGVQPGKVKIGMHSHKH